MIIFDYEAQPAPFFRESNLPIVTVIANGTQCSEAICLIEGQIASAPTPIPTLWLRNDGNDEQ